MTDELRTAAQRLIEDAEDKHWGEHKFCQDAVKLARHYLAQSDGEAVTVEWLKSIGGLPDDSGDGSLYFKVWQPHEGGTRFFDDGKGDAVEMYFCIDGEYGFEEYDEHGKSLAIVTVGKVTTRGQVLALLEALGVKPNE